VEQEGHVFSGLYIYCSTVSVCYGFGFGALS
jgi:hypothetical protein